MDMCRQEGGERRGGGRGVSEESDAGEDERKGGRRCVDGWQGNGAVGLDGRRRGCRMGDDVRGY